MGIHTIEYLINAVEAKGLNYIVQDKVIGYDYDDDFKKVYQYADDCLEIGIEWRGFYYWYDLHLSNNFYLFNHRYSTKVGQAVKGLKTSWKFEDFLFKK